MVISPVLSSKFLSPTLMAGPVGTLVTAGTDYSRRVFWAISLVADGAAATVLLDGEAEEEVHDLFFLRSASGFRM